MKRNLAFLAVFAVLLGIGWGIGQDSPDGVALTIEETQSLLARDSSIVLLDVRTPGEYSGRSGHIAGSILIPVQELQGRLGELDSHRNKNLVVYCRTDNRSKVAVNMLKAAGFNARYVVGGITRWNANQYPVEVSGGQ